MVAIRTKTLTVRFFFQNSTYFYVITIGDFLKPKLGKGPQCPFVPRLFLYCPLFSINFSSSTVGCNFVSFARIVWRLFVWTSVCLSLSFPSPIALIFLLCGRQFRNLFWINRWFVIVEKVSFFKISQRLPVSDFMKSKAMYNEGVGSTELLHGGNLWLCQICM